MAENAGLFIGDTPIKGVYLGDILLTGEGAETWDYANPSIYNIVLSDSVKLYEYAPAKGGTGSVVVPLNIQKLLVSSKKNVEWENFTQAKPQLTFTFDKNESGVYRSQRVSDVLEYGDTAKVFEADVYQNGVFCSRGLEVDGAEVIASGDANSVAKQTIYIALYNSTKDGNKAINVQWKTQEFTYTFTTQNSTGDMKTFTKLCTFGSTTYDGITLAPIDFYVKFRQYPVRKTLSIDLGNSWRASSVAIEGYEVYESNSNHNVNGGISAMKLSWMGTEKIEFYIASYAESTYDYTIVAPVNRDVIITTTSSTSTSNIMGYTNDTTSTWNSGNDVILGAIASTKGNQNNPTYGLSGFTRVECSGPNMYTNFVWIIYGKDTTQNSNNDRGYLAINTIKYKIENIAI